MQEKFAGAEPRYSLINWRISSEKGEIDILCPCAASFNHWEIHSTEGDLFEDVERYDSLFEMVDRIKELLK